ELLNRARSRTRVQLQVALVESGMNLNDGGEQVCLLPDARGNRKIHRLDEMQHAVQLLGQVRARRELVVVTPEVLFKFSVSIEVRTQGRCTYRQGKAHVFHAANLSSAKDPMR